MTMLGVASFLASNHGSDIAPFITGGGSAAAVGGLVYFAKKIITGDLVPAPIAENEKKLAELEERAAKREAELQKIIDAHRKHDIEMSHMLQATRETISEQSRLFYQMIVHLSEGGQKHE